MINLKKAIADSIMTNPTIYALIQDRVYRKRNDKNVHPPFIVYDIAGYQNKLWQHQSKHWYQGNKVIIDIIGEYMYEDQLDEVADALITQRWWFVGELTNTWSWTIALEGRDEGYDPVTDYSVVRLFFLFKHTY